MGGWVGVVVTQPPPHHLAACERRMDMMEVSHRGVTRRLVSGRVEAFGIGVAVGAILSFQDCVILWQ